MKFKNIHKAFVSAVLTEWPAWQATITELDRTPRQFLNLDTFGT